MPISRRLFLKTVTLVNTSSLSCAMGFSLHFSKNIPPEYTTLAEGENDLDRFLDSRYGRGAWTYSSDSLVVKAPNLAENPALIPIFIGTDAPSRVGRYRKILVFAQRSVDVLDSKRFDTNYLPPIYYVDSGFWQQKNNAKALQIDEMTYRKSVINLVAEYELGEQTFPQISMRLNPSGASQLLTFAVFIPRDTSWKIAVAKQSQHTHLWTGCERTIYVEGNWPQGLKSDYEYR